MNLMIMQDDYDVLDRNETSLCTSVDIHDPCKSVYGNLDEVSKSLYYSQLETTSTHETIILLLICFCH